MSSYFNPSPTGNARTSLSSGENNSLITGGATPRTPNQRASGNFTNLQKYFDANKDSEGKMADSISGTIKNQADEVEKNIGKTKGEFDTESSTSVKPFDQADDMAKQLSADPNQLAKDENIGTFNTVRDGDYKGPKGLSDIKSANVFGGDQLRDQTRNVNEMSKQAQTQSGRYNLLRQVFNKPTYSSGQQSLDNALMQTPEQKHTLQNTAQFSNNLNNTFDTANTSAQNTFNTNLGTAQTASGKVQTALADRITKFDTDAKTASDTANSLKHDQWDLAQKNISQGYMTNDDYNRFGIQNSGLYNLSPEKLAAYVTEGENSTKQNILHKDDYITKDNLAKLANGSNFNRAATPNFNPDTILSDYADKDQADGFKASDNYKFNAAKFGTDQAGVQNDYLNNVNPMYQAMNAINPHQEGIDAVNNASVWDQIWKPVQKNAENAARGRIADYQNSIRNEQAARGVDSNGNSLNHFQLLDKYIKRQ